jgi:two-component system sensor histidine kinase KdpD
MTRFDRPWAARAGGYALAGAAVVVVSVLIGVVLGQVNLANASLLYLFAVLATAVAVGRGPAIFAALAAFLVFDWFFVEPAHHLAVVDPEEWISLLVFLLTAVVTGQLAAAQRQQAQEARRREREAVTLYDVVRLLGDGDLEAALPAIAERLRGELALAAVAIDIPDAGGEARRFGAGDVDRLPAVTGSGAGAVRVLQSPPRVAGQSPEAHATPGRWVRVVRELPASMVGGRAVHLVPIRAGERRVGALRLMSSGAPFTAVDDRLLSAAAAQIGQALERDRLRTAATESEILRRTDRLRTAVLNAVSHDLRTPLATIMASAGSLRQQDVVWTEAERQSFAQAIEEEAEHLNRVVGNLLDISRIEGGSLRPQMSWHEVGPLVDDVVDRVRPLLRRHVLTVGVAPELPPVWLDPVEIGQVLYNLLDNAAKYAPPGTSVELTVERVGPRVQFVVADRGPGIAAAAIPRLFDPFYRVMAGQPRAQGLGLGLAIVRGLVEAHGGVVTADPRPGGGARFTVTLPIAPADAAPAQPELLAVPG